MIINGFDLNRLKDHPRVLEVKFMILFDMFDREYGLIKTLEFFQVICDSFNCSFNILRTIIDRRFSIKRTQKTSYVFWRQQVILMGMIRDESPYRIAKYFLSLKPSQMYMQADLYKIDNFLSEEWIKKLDDEVVICGVDLYREELKRFFVAIEGIGAVLHKWNRGKN